MSPKPNQRHTPPLKSFVILWFSLIFILSGALGPSWAVVDYGELFYKDVNGDKAFSPKGRPVISTQNAGPFQEAAGAHSIKVKSEVRIEGLEHVRILTVRVPLLPEKEDRWQSLYVTDKDDIILGIHLFPADETNGEFQLPINGVINYIRIYVECKSHGVWLTEFTLRTRKETP